jgi:Beta-galactosidase
MKYIPPLFTIFTRKICLIGLVSACSLLLVQAAPPPSAFGVWSKGSSYMVKGTDYPFMRGGAFNKKWKEVEKTPGVYDWSDLDKTIETAIQKNIYLYVSIDVGPDSPEWIYSQGVPKVMVSGDKHEKFSAGYPYYLSPKYKELYARVIYKLNEHIRSLPEVKQSHIAFVQVKTGCTGDENPYKGKAKDKTYEIEKHSSQWQDFRIWAFGMFTDTFQRVQGQTPISLLVNDVSDDSEEGENDSSAGKYQKAWEWVIKNIKAGFGVKITGSGRGHHLSGELTKIKMWQPYLIDPKGMQLFARSEMDGTFERPWFELNEPMGFYWAAITALQNGQSIWDVNDKAAASAVLYGYDHAFYFFNRYAGQIYPKTATDAFCALHKGLDMEDTVSFPESKFGGARHDNIDRAVKICNVYVKYGAAIDDKSALPLGQVQQRPKQTGNNDVGWDIWRDNYSRFLYQIDADATSIPLWRIGGPITKTSSIYSRFARGFEHASGKDAMYFKLHDGFSQGNGPKVMTITVVWYDAVAGSNWKLDYDAGKPAMKTALSVTGKGDKQWHHEVVTLNDAVFNQGGTRGADLALVNTDDKDDIFSLIEVHRGVPDGPPLRPSTKNYSPDSGAQSAKLNKK